MLESDAGKDKRLLDLCLDVIYHANMKAFGLQQLVLAIDLTIRDFLKMQMMSEGHRS